MVDPGEQGALGVEAEVVKVRVHGRLAQAFPRGRVPHLENGTGIIGGSGNKHPQEAGPIGTEPQALHLRGLYVVAELERGKWDMFLAVPKRVPGRQPFAVRAETRASIFARPPCRSTPLRGCWPGYLQQVPSIDVPNETQPR